MPREVVLIVSSSMNWVSTTFITMVLLQNCIDMRSGDRTEVLHVHLEGVSDVKEEENHEQTSTPLTDPTVGFILFSVDHAS